SEAPRLADACRDFLTTLRHYTVGRTDTGEVVLLERKHVLGRTPFEGCVSDDQCNALAQVASRIDGTADPFIVTGSIRRTNWSCQTDPPRAPVNADPTMNKRCVQTCVVNPSAANQNPFECANGSVCRPLAALTSPDQPDVPGVCLEGVEPPQAC